MSFLSQDQCHPWGWGLPIWTLLCYLMRADHLYPSLFWSLYYILPLDSFWNVILEFGDKKHFWLCAMGCGSTPLSQIKYRMEVGKRLEKNHWFPVLCRRWQVEKNNRWQFFPVSYLPSTCYLHHYLCQYYTHTAVSNQLMYIQTIMYFFLKILFE